MLRDKSLIPLSHQHQRALALCVRIDRASPIADGDTEAWQREIAQEFQSEIAVHFAAEEKYLFPVARRFAELTALVDDLLGEHAGLRRYFAEAAEHKLKPPALTEFARMLSTHIRKEERQLFESLQQLLNPEQLGELGTNLNEALAEAEHSCTLPSRSTRSRASKET